MKYGRRLNDDGIHNIVHTPYMKYGRRLNDDGIHNIVHTHDDGVHEIWKTTQ